MKRTGRRRKRHGTAPTVSIDRAIERSSDSSFVEQGLQAGLAALAVPLTSAYITNKTTLTTSMTPQNARLLVAGGGLVTAVVVHRSYPSLAMGLAISSLVFGAFPYVQGALQQYVGPVPAT